jgi:hypothetical protein
MSYDRVGELGGQSGVAMSRTRPLTSSTNRASSGMARWAVAFAVLSNLVWGQESRAPTFADYHVTSVYAGAVKQPDFGRPEQYSGTDVRCFGDPAAYSAMRVNFAGHFVLATCSCGSGCHYLFIWDAMNGKVYRDFAFGAIDVGHNSVAYAGERFRADSNLLVLDGCFEDTCDCAKRYYVWNGTKFKLIFRHQDRLPPGCKP